MARQGVRYPTLDDLQVADPQSHRPVPRDGRTLGEVMLRGNTIMKGYLKNPRATATAFREGWYHTGDLAVWHPDGYIEVKDRSKDIIISGGENISSLEVEECLYRHPKVMEAAVVARPDERWGEGVCAFVVAKARRRRDFRRGNHRMVSRASRAFQGAAHRRVRRAAEDLHREDPEVRPARARPNACRLRAVWHNSNARLKFVIFD
jgi:fatty-acyl-CoA synthase